MAGYDRIPLNITERLTKDSVVVMQLEVTADNGDFNFSSIAKMEVVGSKCTDIGA